jgi:hypothetical protein
MEDPNLILTLRADSLRAEKAFSLSYNKDRYLGPIENNTTEIFSRETTPSVYQGLGDQEDLSSRIQWTFDRRPRNIQRGLGCGSNPNTCDVLLGRAKQGISAEHFYITFDE